MGLDAFVIGCWVKTDLYEKVVVLDINVKDDCIALRYPAHKAHYDDEGNLSYASDVMWVFNGARLSACTFLAPPDEESRRILNLTGPYGKSPVGEQHEVCGS